MKKILILIFVTIISFLTSCSFNTESGSINFENNEFKFKNSDKLDEESIKSILKKSCESSKNLCKNESTFKPLKAIITPRNQSTNELCSKVFSSDTYSGYTTEVKLVFQATNSVGVTGELMSIILFDKKTLKGITIVGDYLEIELKNKYFFDFQ